jgi:hypothetical protein
MNRIFWTGEVLHGSEGEYARTLFKGLALNLASCRLGLPRPGEDGKAKVRRRNVIVRR